MALMAAAIKAYCGNNETAFHKSQEVLSRKAREMAATVFGMGNIPPMWPGEEGAAEEPVQVKEKKED